jgi:hypothetical protein
MKHILFFVALFCVNQLTAQKYDYIWLTGDQNMPGDSSYGGAILNFNALPPTTVYNYRKLNLRTCNASICDTAGHLLFYTNGCAIAGANNEILENGDTLNPGDIYNSWCSDPEYGYYVSGYQSALVLPLPESDHLYYLFHKGIYDQYNPLKVITNHFYYSLVDMGANNGKGKVLKKNVEIMGGYLSFGDITSVKHANGKDWWIVTAEGESDKFYCFLLTKEGIVDTVIQHTGIIPYGPNTEGGGQITFSPDGTKMARTNPDYGFNLFNFNRGTGIFTSVDSFNVNYAGWDPVTTQCAFSPNNRFLYISCELWIFQFDLWANNIGATQTTVATWDGFKSPVGTIFYYLQLGPDCKLYGNTIDCHYYHIIHHPNEQGLACDVEQHGLQFPTSTGATIPNFPNYRLGPLNNPGVPCSAIVDSKQPVITPLPLFSVFPNPAVDYLKIISNHQVVGRIVFSVRDPLGRMVQQQDLNDGDKTVLDISALPAGVYFYSVESRKGVLQTGKVIVR